MYCSVVFVYYAERKERRKMMISYRFIEHKSCSLSYIPFYNAAVHIAVRIYKKESRAHLNHTAYKIMPLAHTDPKDSN